MGHPEVHHWAQLRPTDEVTNTPIKATANNDDIWSKLLCDRQNNLLKGKFVFVPTEIASLVVLSIVLIDLFNICVPCDVDVETSPFALADEIHSSIVSVGVEFTLFTSVERDQQHLVTIVKAVLSTISLMDIPIHHQHTLTHINTLCCGYCDVIKEAEALGNLQMCMVTWRTD